MKRIIVIIAIALLGHTAIMAQTEKAVAEKDVKLNYVKDFQRQMKDATSVAWWQIDADTYKVTYLDADKSRQAMLFSSKGTETHYFIDRQYYPAAIKDTVSHLYPKFRITDVWVRKVRGKMTYQARIAQTKGILFWKKEKEARLINFEVDGKFIGE